MGIASSSFPTLAVLALEVFHFPLIASFWYNNRTHTGYAIALVYTYFWWLIRVGFDLGNPLLPIVSVDLFFESIRIYAGWFVVFSALAALIGWSICVLMDMREPIPFYAILPTFESYVIDTSGPTPCQESDFDTVEKYDAECRLGLQRWCFEHVEPPYWHTLVGVLLELFTLSIPAILFWSFLSWNKWAAFGTPLVMKVIGYVVAGLYWSYRTDLYVWGPAEYNIAPRRLVAKSDDNSLYAYDPPMDRSGILFRRTQTTVMRNVLVMGLIDTALFLIIAGMIVFPATMPAFNTIIGISLALIIMIGLAILAFTLIQWLRTQVTGDVTNGSGSITNASRCRITSTEDTLDDEVLNFTCPPSSKPRPMRSKRPALPMPMNNGMLLLTGK